MDQPSAREEWLTHWPLLLCCLLGITVPIVPIYALGQFLPSIEKSFGWSRTQVSSGLTLSLCIGFFATPLIGRLIDRTNARRLVLPGIVLSAAASAAFSTANGSMAGWLGLWACYAIASALICPAVWLPVVANAFSTGRSLAMAVALCGISLPAAYGPPLARALIDHFGWRTSYQVLSFVVAMPALLCSALFFFDRRPLGAGRHGVSQAPQASAPGSLRRIYLSLTFFRLAVSVFVSNIAFAALVIHLAPILVDSGLTPTTAAAVSGVAGLTAIGGMLLTGTLFDRIRPTWAAAGLMVLFALACMLFTAHSANIVVAVAESLLLWTCAGGMGALLACITPTLFSHRVFGSVYAVLLSLTALGGAIAPLLASMVRDATGSYNAVFLVSIIVAAGSAVLFIGIKPLKESSAGGT